MSTEYDLIVIGSGPGGYVAAERAGGHGLKTMIVEKSHLGGICLNEGCIPSKTLLYSAKLYQQAVNGAVYGVLADGVRFDLAAAMKRKNKTMMTLRKGVAYQMKRHKVEVLTGEATFLDDQTISVEGNTYRAKNFIVATGSSPVRPPIPGADLPHVLTSSEIFYLEQLPEKLVIVGGGVIGMEFACFFSAVGVEVTVVEMLEEVLPTFDPDLAQGLRRQMRAVTFKLGSKVASIDAQLVTLSKGEEVETIPADMVLMSVGRCPNTAGLGLESAGVDIGPNGIVVDDKMQTTNPHIFAVGDVNGKSLLAHSASRMGEVVVNNLVESDDTMRYHAVPYVVYTFPDVAACGMTERQALAAGRKVDVAKLAMQANCRHQAEHNRPAGMVKVVVDAESRRLLGVHMLGTYASELIHSAAIMIEQEMKVEDIRKIIFPHPTVGEIVRDALWELPM
ncbi:dihydrolipoyl dehydrogenase [bacterium M21]|nr:dihydrolipoyl dehydrogenase [bacterium M21]